MIVQQPGSNRNNLGRTLEQALVVAALIAVTASPALAQTGQSPWEQAIGVLAAFFVGPAARGLSLIAIVVGSLLLAFGDQSNRLLAQLIFGVGGAVGAVNLLSWLFGV